MVEIVHAVKDLAALERLWRQGLRHGALLIPVHPLPNSGDEVTVVLRPAFQSGIVKLPARVTQATQAITILQLAPLTAEVRDQLVGLGLTDAGKEAKVSAPGTVAAPQPAPVAAPEPVPQPVAEAAPKSKVRKAFKPKSKAFRPTAGRATTAPRSSGSLPTVGPPEVPDAPRSADARQRAIFAASGPANQQTEKLLPTAVEHGDLARFSWRDVLLHFLRKKATGVLAIDGFREVRWAYLIDGQPVHYLGSTPHPGEYLADALLQAGQIRQSEWTDALKLQRISGVPAGTILVLRGKLKQGQLDEAITRRADRITRNLLGANFGRFRFHPYEDIRLVMKNAPVQVLDLLWGAQMELLNAAEDDALVMKAEKLYDMRVRVLEARKDLLTELPMTSYESHVALELLPAAWTLKELVALNEIEERSLLKLVFALDAMGVVEFVQPEEESSKTRRAQRILYEGWKDLSKRDPFTRVHAHWSSNLAEIEFGYARLMKEFRRGRFGADTDRRVTELLDRIHKLGNDAYESLKTKPGRVEARKGIVGNDQLQMASDLLDKQGEMALYKQDYPVAKALYEKVIELDPGAPEGKEYRKRAKMNLARPELVNASTAGVVFADLTRQVDQMVADSAPGKEPGT
jgi:hypothetical protein